MMWIDLSAPLTPNLPVWPGDPSFRRRRVKAIAEGDPANLSELCLSAHAGTHLDAPVHFIEGAVGCEGVSLTSVMGRARVLQLEDESEIDADSLRKAGVSPGERLLLRTHNSRSPWWQEPFREDAVGLSIAAAELLAELKVACVGIDSLSIATFRGDGGRIHRTLLEAGVTIIEGLVLERLTAGAVELLCLPLLLPGLDGAPARALARKIG